MNLTRKSSHQRGARFTTRAVAITLLLIGGFALRGHPVSAATQGGVAKLANPGTAQPLTSGGSATPFTVTLPTAAACSGDTVTGGYHVFSYLVPKGTSVTSVTFTGFPSTGYGFVDNTSTYYGNVNTALTTGQVPSLPTNFAWGPLAETGGGVVPLATLLGGGTSATWETGIVCATSAGAASDWWSTDVTFTASGSDAGGFTWTTGATAPASTTTTKPANTSTTKPPKTTTTLGQQATPTTIAAGGTSTTVAGETTTTVFGSTPTTAFVAGTDTGTDGFVDPISSGSTGTLPRTGSPIHRDMGLALFAIGTGMMLIGIDLRWKVRRSSRVMTQASGDTLISPADHAAAPDERRTVVVAAPAPAPATVAPERHDRFAGAGPVVRTVLLTLAFTMLVFVVYLVIGTPLQHHAAQESRFANFRGKLAKGIAPISPVDADGRPLALGTPIAVIRIPASGLREVVGEGTTPGVLTSGPGHLRSTVFPGGAGTSVVFGRAGAFGAPFRSITKLDKGATIEVTTGTGTAKFRVVGVRHSGDRIPALKAGGARLTLVTAGGTRFVPDGVVFVDADLVGTPLGAAAPPASAVAKSEQPLGTDSSTLFALVLWLQALLLIVAGAVWAWHHRSPAHAWLLFFAPAAFVATEVAAQLTHLLPNLL